MERTLVVITVNEFDRLQGFQEFARLAFPHRSIGQVLGFKAAQVTGGGVIHCPPPQQMQVPNHARHTHLEEACGALRLPMPTHLLVTLDPGHGSVVLEHDAAIAYLQRGHHIGKGRMGRVQQLLHHWAVSALH